MEAVIKSGAASRKANIRESRGAQPSPAVRMPSRRPLAPLDLWILVFLEAALAADLITASISLHVPTAAKPFLDPAV